MWVLEAQSFGVNDERSQATQTCKHYLTAGSHVVGRQAGQCALVVEEDKSISRSHAIVTVSYADDGQCLVKGKRTAPLRKLLQHLHGIRATLRQQPIWYFGQQERAQWRSAVGASRGLTAIWSQIYLQVSLQCCEIAHHDLALDAPDRQLPLHVLQGLQVEL